VVFVFACNQDIDSRMELLELVKDSFPGLDKEAYIKGLQVCIIQKEALVAKKDGIVIYKLVTRFNGLQEFLSREDVGSVMVKYYQSVNLNKIELETDFH